ncbi:MAG: ral stress protein CsbD [Betaproteobacteria bacterium]|jgi:uncharacterized protein YjbJ (UPF0337 family)|nr:ral stress protein CsbD [Betaproteobacteria bacterium]
MNRHRIEGAWKELKGAVKEQWAAISDNELAFAAGKRDQIAGRMQRLYGLATDRSEQQLRDWRKQMKTQ